MPKRSPWNLRTRPPRKPLAPCSAGSKSYNFCSKPPSFQAILTYCQMNRKPFVQIKPCKTSQIGDTSTQPTLGRPPLPFPLQFFFLKRDQKDERGKEASNNDVLPLLLWPPWLGLPHLRISGNKIPPPDWAPWSPDREHRAGSEPAEISPSSFRD